MNEVLLEDPRRGEKVESVAVDARRTTQVLRDRGHGDPVVALPSPWLEDLGWKAGDLLVISRWTGAKLLLSRDSPEGAVPPVAIELPPNTPKEHLFRRLVSAYLGGAEEITVRAPSPLPTAHLQVVREFTRRVPELQVTYEAKDRIVLRGGPERTARGPSQLLRGMVRRVLELHRQAGRSWDRPSSTPRSTPFVILDDEVDHEAWLMERMLVRGMAEGMYFGGDRSDPVAGVNYLMAARTLERIADHAVRIGEEGRRLVVGPPELRASLAALHAQVVELLGAAKDLLEHPEIEPANVLIDAADRFLSGREAFGRTSLQFSRGWASRGSLVLPTNLVLESMRRTASYVADLGEIALDLQVHR